MSIQDLSTDHNHALEFAESEFAKGTRFWPRLLVRCLESIKQGNALDVVQCLYARENVPETMVSHETLLKELKDISSAPTLRNRSSEIWTDRLHQSKTCRGITRLFNAKASLLEFGFEDYEIELTRALGMLAAAEDPIEASRRFKRILRRVRRQLDG